jgi:hypothetical protein
MRIRKFRHAALDCFVAALLAMTIFLGSRDGTEGTEEFYARLFEAIS